MNVRCQSCETVYRIDPLKVPVEGVHARCTVCSAVIPVERITEEDAPATDRPMTPHAPSTEDRVAHALGDAFIPAPAAEEAAGIGDEDSYSDLDFPEGPGSAEQREAERHKVESLPGIIMPPDEDLEEEAAPAAPAVAPTAESGEEQGAALPRAPAEAARSRVSRPFLPPRDLPFARPTLEPAEARVRPTAPVFRPTPGRPARAPVSAPSKPAVVPPVPAPPPASAGTSAPAAPSVPPSPAPRGPSLSPPPAAPAPPSAPPTPPAGTSSPPSVRPINPFLSRDPGQKARRLARALISDMIVYQPEKRQQALEEGNLAEAFDEEIKKSWDEYVEQVGEEIANSTTYFNDALNELLADGDKVF